MDSLFALINYNGTLTDHSVTFIPHSVTHSCVTNVTEMRCDGDDNKLIIMAMHPYRLTATGRPFCVSGLYHKLHDKIGSSTAVTLYDRRNWCGRNEAYKYYALFLRVTVHI